MAKKEGTKSREEKSQKDLETREAEIKRQEEAEAKRLEDIDNEERVIQPFEFNVLRKGDEHKLLRCGDSVKHKNEKDVSGVLHFKRDRNKYKFIDIGESTFEVVLNAEKKQWELCTHEGNDYHPETGEPVVRRKVHETFPLSEEEMKDI